MLVLSKRFLGAAMLVCTAWYAIPVAAGARVETGRKVAIAGQDEIAGNLGLFEVPVAGKVGCILDGFSAGPFLMEVAGGTTTAKPLTYRSAPEFEKVPTTAVAPFGNTFGVLYGCGVALYDMAKQECGYVPACGGMGSVVSAGPLGSSGLLLCEVKEHTGFQEGTRTLRVVGPSGQQEASMELPFCSGYNCSPVEVAQSKVFAWDGVNSKIAVYDSKLKTASHPLNNFGGTDALKLRFLVTMAVHPSLPVAVLVDRAKERNQDYRVLLASWGGGTVATRQIAGIASDRLCVNWARFSPDGKWVALCDLESENGTNGYILPVVDANMAGVETYTKLVGTEGEPLSEFAWTRSPVALVGHNGTGTLFVWEPGRTSK